MLDKLMVVWYCPGMRGNAIYRILAAHPEVYWNINFQQMTTEFIAHPLDLPNLETAINIDANAYIYNKLSRWKFSYCSYHAIGYVHDPNTKKLIKAWINSKAYTDNYMFIYNHCKQLITTDDDLLMLDSKPHIWLYGTRDRLNMPKAYYKPSTNPLAYNLNVDYLFSTDYSTFETEYYKLIAHFNLTSCINRVRAFILLTLERETYISKFY
jgi:hypothetical protein